jgi:hypothetical protein
MQIINVTLNRRVIAHLCKGTIKIFKTIVQCVYTTNDPVYIYFSSVLKAFRDTCIFFGGLEYVGHSFADVAYFAFCIFDGYLDSNIESCCSKQARY